MNLYKILRASALFFVVFALTILSGCGGGGTGNGSNLVSGNCDRCNLPDAPIDPYPGPAGRVADRSHDEIPVDWLHWPVAPGVPMQVSLAYDWSTHRGPLRYAIDFKHATGIPANTRFLPVVAAADGLVSFAGSGGSLDPLALYGNRVDVDHQNGWGTRYAHLESINVARGDSVGIHQIIGRIGSSGAPDRWYRNPPGNPHLHFEVRPIGSVLVVGSTHKPEPIDGVWDLYREMPVMHDAGGRIAFMSDRDGNPEIYVMNGDGTDQVRLTNSAAFDGDPKFSPDGTKIVFASERDGNMEIYTMNVDGTNVTRLTFDPSIDGVPIFSPDGTKIAFDSTRDGNPEIYIMNVNGTNPVRLTDNIADDREPAFSPTGSKIAFESTRDGNREIYIMNADGSAQTRLTNNPGNDGVPTFSLDGTKIAFDSDRDGNTEVYIMNANGTNQTRLTFNPAFDGVPSFSIDGVRIAFDSNRDGNHEIYVMNTNGSNQANRSNNPANEFAPCFR